MCYDLGKDDCNFDYIDNLYGLFKYDVAVLL